MIALDVVVNAIRLGLASAVRSACHFVAEIHFHASIFEDIEKLDCILQVHELGGVVWGFRLDLNG